MVGYSAAEPGPVARLAAAENGCYFC